MTTKTITLAKAYHPGITLDEKLKEERMSIKEFAVRTSKPEKTIIAVIKGESSITTEMAIAFENVTKIPAHFWISKQQLYDEYKARIKRAETFAHSVEWVKSFPLKEMIKRNWLPQCATPEEKVNALLSFFGMSNEKAWENYYINEELKIAFRLSLAHTKNPHAISAWLRQGELQSKEITTESPYSIKKLKSLLPSMKEIMAKEDDNYFKALQALCLEAGIILIETDCLPKAPINGATRWINDTPIIQLSNRYHRYDIFWFTFFHEIGHILLHGKKDVFLEGEIMTKQQEDKEKEADDFSSELLFSTQEEEKLIHSGNLSELSIIRTAEACHTHPSIIVGRLQYKGIIPHWEMKNLLKTIS